MILTIDDTHFPTLTVGQTLDFALDVKVPKKRLPGESKSQFKKDVINTLLKMYNIEHTKNTLLGGSARVRGTGRAALSSDKKLRFAEKLQ